MKKFTGLLLALVMVFALTTTAFAANTNQHIITITNEKDGHTYTAYQVFQGDYYEGKLSNIEWGAGVNGEALLAELKGSVSNVYTSCTTSEDVAKVLASFQNDSAQLDAFARIVGKHLSTAAGSSDEQKSPYRISVTGDGYYFIKDNGTIAEDDAATKYILQVVHDVSVAAKVDVPTLDKVIVEADSDTNETPADENTDGNGTAVNVGDKVNFKLTSKVPKMDSYDTYTYVVHDTMSSGLTFNNDVAVTIGGDAYNAFTVAQDGQSFTITFTDFINQKANAGKAIVITYSATLNENALSTNVETNTVYLNYSNNPNDTSTQGKTPDKTVYVYDFDLVIDKYTKNDDNSEIRLANAKFVLYKKDGEKKLYYFYNATDKKVTWVELADDAAVKTAVTAGTITQVVTDASGVASFRGLDTGTYFLHETEAPAGYNLLKEDVEVAITATYGNDGKITQSTAAPADNGQYQQTEKILNNSGTQLPSTGGIGTAIFYGLGGLLVLGAIVLLVTRRRMKD